MKYFADVLVDSYGTMKACPALSIAGCGLNRPTVKMRWAVDYGLTIPVNVFIIII
jgi:hypothetical protein